MSSSWIDAADVIRPADKTDEHDLVRFLIELELFGKDEIEELRSLLKSWFSSENSPEFWVVSTDSKSVIDGVAYCAPERMAEGAWNLYLIAVRAEQRGRGLGQALLREVEAIAEARAGRVLLIETSNTDAFRRTRTFYSRAGYCEEAKIRDFYKQGDDKIVFWKSLVSAVRPDSLINDVRQKTKASR